MDSALLIVVGVVSRIMPHPANMTAVGGIALFSGARLGVKKGVIITLASMLVSDLFIGHHPYMWAVYLGMVCAVVLGSVLQKTQSLIHIAIVSLSASTVFFVITNTAVWAFGTLYPHTVDGFVRCFVMALPFFRNSAVGDIISSMVFLYAYDRLKARGCLYGLHRVLRKKVLEWYALVVPGIMESIAVHRSTRKALEMVEQKRIRE